MIKTFTIREGQTLWDLALQLYGDASRVYDIIKLNPATVPHILTTKLTGLTINYEEQNNDVANYYKANGINVISRNPEHTAYAVSWSVSFSSPFVPPPTT